VRSLSVIIPARDAADTIGAQLDALLGQPFDGRLEIIVVDNGSTDGTRARIEERGDARVQVVDATERHGCGYPRNVGARHATSDRLAMCDADDVVSSGWVQAMSDALEQAAYVTGPIDITLLNPPAVVGSRGDTFPKPGAPVFAGMFPFAHGCNIGVRREAFERVGGFDEHLPPSEDVDFGLRMHVAGIPLHFAPDALVHYRYRTSLRDLLRQSRTYASTRHELYRRARAAGLQPPTARQGARRTLWLVRNAHRLRVPQFRSRWVWVAGDVIGASTNRPAPPARRRRRR
jgi:GT2 family glycosyltransferase